VSLGFSSGPPSKETDHPETAITLNNFAMAYASQGCYSDAQPLFERALAIHENVFGSPGSNPLACSARTKHG
jgi:hypothetical protein